MTPQPTSERYEVRATIVNTYYIWDTIGNVIRSGYGDKDDMVRYAGKLNARNARPAPDTIETTVIWHRGGASGAPWPWGEAKESHEIVATAHNKFNGSIWLGLTKIRIESWKNIEYWCEAADLQPPTFEERPATINPPEGERGE